MAENTLHSRKYKGLADKVLLACVLAFAAATGYLLLVPHSKWLIFIQSVAAAAIVGGIADWYGVVSIYGRPLGISYRTEIIVQKRAQLVTAMRAFICDDLLSQENINDKLTTYPLTERLLELFESRPNEEGPFTWLSNFGAAILYEIVNRTDTKEISSRISTLLAGSVERVGPATEAIRIARWSLEAGYADRLLNILTPGLQKIASNNGFRSIVHEFAETAVNRYVGDNSLRQIFVEKLLQEQLLERAAEQVVAYLDEVQDDPHHPLRDEIRHRIAAFLDRLEGDKEQQEAIEAWLARLLQSEEAHRVLIPAIDRIKTSTLSREGCMTTVEGILGGFLSRLRTDPDVRSVLNQWLLEQLSSTIERHHDQVGSLVEASLNSMNNAELVHFVREGIENDLQLIRVNGMLFGMAIGMVVAVIRLVTT